MADQGNNNPQVGSMPPSNNTNQLADLAVSTNANATSNGNNAGAASAGTMVKQEDNKIAGGGGGDSDSEKNGDEDVPMTFPQRVSCRCACTKRPDSC